MTKTHAIQEANLALDTNPTPLAICNMIMRMSEKRFIPPALSGKLIDIIQNDRADPKAVVRVLINHLNT